MTNIYNPNNKLFTAILSHYLYLGNGIPIKKHKSALKRLKTVLYDILQYINTLQLFVYQQYEEIE